MDLVNAAIRKLMGACEHGFDLYLHCDAPPGTGLGSSSAMMVVLVGLLMEWKNRKPRAMGCERREVALEPDGLQTWRVA